MSCRSCWRVGQLLHAWQCCAGGFRAELRVKAGQSSAVHAADASWLRVTHLRGGLRCLKSSCKGLAVAHFATAECAQLLMKAAGSAGACTGCLSSIISYRDLACITPIRHVWARDHIMVPCSFSLLAVPSPSRVVLPLPDGPMRAVISPGCSRPLTPCRSAIFWRLLL